MVHGEVDTTRHRQRHGHITMLPDCASAPGWVPHEAGVPSLASWLARRAWISAQAPVIRAMCTESINKPFRQHPAPSPRCGQMPGKPLAEVRGLLLPRFTACGQEPRYLFAGSIARRVCRALWRDEMSCPAAGGCQHPWGAWTWTLYSCQQLAGGGFMANTKCSPFSMGGAGAGITWMLPCVRSSTDYILSPSGLSQPERVLVLFALKEVQHSPLLPLFSEFLLRVLPCPAGRLGLLCCPAPEP